MISTLRSINEIAYIISGGTPKTTVREYWDGNIPWLSVKDFNNDSKYVYSAEKSITELGLKQSAANLLQHEDIIISARGTVGLIAKISQPMAFNQSCFGIRSKGEVDQDYLYYAMKYSVASLKLLTQGSVFSTINRATFDKWKIPVPAINVQREISMILSSIDKKLAVNNQLNDYLAEIRQLIVKMKISDIFNRDDDSCSLVPLKKIAKIQSGYSYKSKELTDNSQIGMLTIKNFQRNGLFKLDGFKPINPANAKESHYVTAGEIVVAHTDLTQNADIIGRAIQVIDNGGFDKILASCDLVKVSSTNESISNELLAALLATSDFYNHCLGYVNGTTVLHLGKKALHEYNLKIPNNTKLLQSLDRCFQSIAFHQSYLIQETRILKKSRDLLLSKLLSGDIDVSKIINE